MKRTKYNTAMLQKRMRALVEKHGGVRTTARVLNVDPSYVSRLCNGGKANPSDAILKRCGLLRLVTYVDELEAEESK